MDKIVIYFKLERNFNMTIEVVSENENTLREYLKKKHNITISDFDPEMEDCQASVENETATYFAEIKWLKVVDITTE